MSKIIKQALTFQHKQEYAISRGLLAVAVASAALNYTRIGALMALVIAAAWVFVAIAERRAS